jgi:ABC-2 type transport system ATP-binding protein
MNAGVTEPLLEVTALEIEGGNHFRLRIDGVATGRGDVLGIVGANGSGKTTFVEGVLGLRARRLGDVKLFGHTFPAHEKNVQDMRRLGVQLQNAAYPSNFKVGEIVHLHMTMYQTADPAMAASFGVPDLHKLFYGRLSNGQKQRVDLYLALAHRPELVFLDEPSSGLDQGYQATCAAILARRAADDRLATVICSHNGAEVSLCNKIVWLRSGAVHQRIDNVAWPMRIGQSDVSADEFLKMVAAEEQERNAAIAA